MHIPDLDGPAYGSHKGGVHFPSREGPEIPRVGHEGRGGNLGPLRPNPDRKGAFKPKPRNKTLSNR